MATKRWLWLGLAALLGLACCATRFHGLAVVLAVAGLCLPSWRAKLAVAGPSLAGAVGLGLMAPPGFLAATFGWHPGLIWPCLVATLTVQTACVGGLIMLAIAIGGKE